MGRRWEYFSQGEFVEDANVTIISVLYRSTRMGATRYLIRFECCKRLEETTHEFIRARQIRGWVRCKQCRQRNNRFALKPEPQIGGHEPWYHGWAPPPSALRLTAAELPK